MDKQKVVAALEEIGLLLELQGQNPFKTRAYHNAARIIGEFDENLQELVERRELTRVKGIGQALADKISTLVEDGRLPYLENLRAEVPSGLLDWLKIPGLGSKKARAIHVALGISTLGELEYACKENRLRDLPGFGERSQTKILAGIERLRQSAGRFHQPVIQAEAARLLELVRAVSGVTRAEVGGSVRRLSETSKDIDIVVSSDDAEPVMDAFALDPGVQEIIGRGPTKCSVQLETGPNADLRVVSEDEFPFALMYFTGSKAHNIAIRGRAQKRGLKLNEYAMIREEDDVRLPCEDEAAIYRTLDLAWIPPELREDQGEIEAAETEELPNLLKTSELQGILHVHSSWSDGSATIREMADEARSMGLHYLGLCDHSQTAVYANGLTVERVAEQHDEIDRLNADYGGEFTILKGIESDILVDGALDYPDEILERFDLVVASIHSRFELPEAEQTARLIRAIENPFVDIVGHITGRLLLAREGYPLDLAAVLDAATEHRVAVEINAHPHRLDLGWRHLRYGLKRGMKTCVNPDAHAPGGLHDISYGVGVARKGWCTAEDTLNAWPLKRLREHLQRRRKTGGSNEPMAGLTESDRKRKNRAGRLVLGLRELYSDADCALHHKSALELLVATILSAQCTDERVNKVTPGLFKRYSTAQDYAIAEMEELCERIRSTGFFRNKAKSLLGLGGALVERHDGEVPRTMEQLVKLAGVGRKTANVVLGTWFGVPSIPVDTHVIRLSGRLELTEERKDAVRIERELQKIIPQEEWTFFSHALIWHGRRVCNARKPDCDHCELRPNCPFPTL